jgi:hypothetical protein
MVVFPHYIGGGPDHCDDRMCERVDALFAVAGRTLAKSHNKFHPNARTLCRPKLMVSGDRFTLVLPYSYAEDAGSGSGWTIDIVHDGAFADFVTHCERKLGNLLTSPATTGDPTVAPGCASARWVDFDHCGDSTSEPYPFDDDAGYPIGAAPLTPCSTKSAETRCSPTKGVSRYPVSVSRANVFRGRG